MVGWLVAAAAAAAEIIQPSSLRTKAQPPAAAISSSVSYAAPQAGGRAGVAGGRGPLQLPPQAHAAQVGATHCRACPPDMPVCSASMLLQLAAQGFTTPYVGAHPPLACLLCPLLLLAGRYCCGPRWRAPLWA